jgi:hypothetical protein
MLSSGLSLDSLYLGSKAVSRRGPHWLGRGVAITEQGWPRLPLSRERVVMVHPRGAGLARVWIG